MFSVKVSYISMLSRMQTVMTTSQTVGTRAEAEELRDALKQIPELATARISIVNAPPPTVDEAMQGFRRSLAEYPVKCWSANQSKLG